MKWHLTVGHCKYHLPKVINGETIIGGPSAQVG